MASEVGKDFILRELLSFFFDELERDPAGTRDWIAQGDADADEFIAKARKLREDIKLRDTGA